MKKKFLFIIPILIVSFLVYWFWPQPTIPSIIDEGHHISQKTRKYIERANAKNKIKIQYLFYNETNELLPTKAQSLELDQKHDVFYVLIKPLNDNQFYDYSETSYVQASPSLEKKLVDTHPNLTSIVGPYMYGKDYDTAILKIEERLRTTIKGYTNQYNVVITTLCTIFIILIILKILLSIFINEDDNHDGNSSNGEDEMLATTNAMLASTIIISSTH